MQLYQPPGLSLLILLFLCTTRVACIPLNHFFPYGAVTGDDELNLSDDDSSSPYTLMPPFKILGRQADPLYVNSNGVISFQDRFTTFSPQLFPRVVTSGLVLICPFWDDVNINNGGTIYYNHNATTSGNRLKIVQLIQQAFGYDFNPTRISVATWDHVRPYQRSDPVPGTNTFQCVLAYNANDSFILFLYADHLIQWSSHGAQVGIDGGDGINYFSIPTSRTADIVNITSTSNVNQPGLWIFKVDTYIIGGPPRAPDNLTITDIGAFTLSLWWDYLNNENIDHSLVNCTARFHEVLQAAYNSSTVTLENLKAYTNYTCFVQSRNIFGFGPQSELITIQTLPGVPSGEPQNIRAEVLSSMSFQLEWSPPLEEHRNGVIMGYKISVEWGVDQVYTIDTPSTNYTITGLERGTTYHYSLAAYTIIGTGPYSNSTAVSLSENQSLNFTVVGAAAGAGALIAMTIIVVLIIICIVIVQTRKKRKIVIAAENPTKQDNMQSPDPRYDVVEMIEQEPLYEIPDTPKEDVVKTEERTSKTLSKPKVGLKPPKPPQNKPLKSSNTTAAIQRASSGDSDQGRQQNQIYTSLYNSTRQPPTTPGDLREKSTEQSQYLPLCESTMNSNRTGQHGPSMYMSLRHERPNKVQQSSEYENLHFRNDIKS